VSVAIKYSSDIATRVRSGAGGNSMKISGTILAPLVVDYRNMFCGQFGELCLRWS